MDTIDNELERNNQEETLETPAGTTEEACDSSVCQTETREEESPIGGPVYVPAVDLVEGEEQVSIIADVPGVAEGGVELTVEKNILTLVAKPEVPSFEGKKLAYSEYGVGEYHCAFTLSDGVDKENISASLKDGVLTINLPKQAPITKKIAVVSA